MFRLFLALQLGILAVGAIWMSLMGFPVVKEPDPLRDTIAFAVLYPVLIGLELVFARVFSNSFRITEALHSQIGSLMREQGVTHHQALALAVASGLAEEVFFRGAIQNALFGGTIGMVLQALIFAGFHPVPDRRAWVYPVFVFVSGLLFGASYLITGSLIPGMMAHYINNARGFYLLLNQSKTISE